MISADTEAYERLAQPPQQPLINISGRSLLVGNIKQNPKTRTERWDFPSPYPLKFRVVRFMLDTGKNETPVTSMPRSITPDKIKELYYARWGIETSFRQLKYKSAL